MGCVKSKSKDEQAYEEAEQMSMLTNFSTDELKKVYDEFMKETPSGQMNRDQFDEFYHKVFSGEKDKNFMDHLFRTFDFNKDGQINFKEFVCGISVTTRGTLDEKLTWTFNVYDVNHDGTITNDEMGEIMRMWSHAGQDRKVKPGKKKPHPQAIYAINGVSEPEQVKTGSEAFKKMDLDGDGLITVAEFVRGAKSDHKLLEMLERTVSTNNILKS